mmetsp:Transcript_48257/g.145860  ORF Transcript_48257/g.145860 Transcript_48257/m.145860 type:complete len:90 (+) Transcript_48257:1197-1466(+)
MALMNPLLAVTAPFRRPDLGSITRKHAILSGWERRARPINITNKIWNWRKERIVISFGIHGKVIPAIPTDDTSGKAKHHGECAAILNIF